MTTSLHVCQGVFFVFLFLHFLSIERVGCQGVKYKKQTDELELREKG